MKRLLHAVLITFIIFILAGCNAESFPTDSAYSTPSILSGKMVSIYYIKNGLLTPATYSIDTNVENYITQASTAIDLLFSGVAPEGFKNELADVKLNSLEISGDTASIDVSGEFLAGGKTDTAKKQIIYTLTECDNIFHINITVDGKPYATMLERPQFINLLNPAEYEKDKENPDELSKYLTIYYTDKNKKNLIPVTIKSDKVKAEDKARVALQYLSEGAGDIENLQIFPKKIEIKNLHVADGIAEVDLDLNSLFEFHNETQYAEIAIEAVSRTLTAIDGIDQVQFLINGKTRDYVTSNVSIKNPIKPDRWYNLVK